MRELMTAFCFAVFALAATGVGTAHSEIRAGGVKFDVPVIAEAGNADLRLIAEGSDDYPPPEGDGDDPDIRFPGDPRV